MTQEHSLLNAVLEKFNGDRDLAAVALEKTRHAIDCAINVDPDLKLRWGKGAGSAGVLAQPNALNRPVNGGISVSQEDKALMKSMITEDALLAEGLERLGLTPEEVQRAVGMQQFGQNQFVQSVQIVGGSMTTICVQLTSQLKEVIQRLNEVRADMKKCATPITRAVLVEEERYLSESLIGMAEQVRRMSDTAHRGMMLQAMIRFKLSGRREGKDKMPKPGFSTSIPVESQVQ